MPKNSNNNPSTLFISYKGLEHAFPLLETSKGSFALKDRINYLELLVTLCKWVTEDPIAKVNKKIHITTKKVTTKISLEDSSVIVNLDAVPLRMKERKNPLKKCYHALDISTKISNKENINNGINNRNFERSRSKINTPHCKLEFLKNSNKSKYGDIKNDYLCKSQKTMSFNEQQLDFSETDDISFKNYTSSIESLKLKPILQSDDKQSEFNSKSIGWCDNSKSIKLFNSSIKKCDQSEAKLSQSQTRVQKHNLNVVIPEKTFLSNIQKRILTEKTEENRTTLGSQPVSPKELINNIAFKNRDSAKSK